MCQSSAGSREVTGGRDFWEAERPISEVARGMGNAADAVPKPFSSREPRGPKHAETAERDGASRDLWPRLVLQRRSFRSAYRIRCRPSVTTEAGVSGVAATSAASNDEAWRSPRIWMFAVCEVVLRMV